MSNLQELQEKITDIILYIDKLCRKNDIIYYIMGGTALGAVRHKGFIPWDDDLDIFMTPQDYKKFREAFYKDNSQLFYLQEWKTAKNYLEHAKLRMNGTTYIEKAFSSNMKMHHGIYVDIMILHKCPDNLPAETLTYLLSKYVTLVALTQREWQPKNLFHALMKKIVKITPNKVLVPLSYRWIYHFDDRKTNFVYCYFITKTSFRQGIMPKEIFQKPISIKFGDIELYAPTKIKKYLRIRYGDYMKLPSEEERKAAVHAEIFDVNQDFKEYLKMPNKQ